MGRRIALSHSASNEEPALYEESSLSIFSSTLSSSSRNLFSCRSLSFSSGVLSRGRFRTQGFECLLQPVFSCLTTALFTARSRNSHNICAEIVIGSCSAPCVWAKASVAKCCNWRSIFADSFGLPFSSRKLYLIILAQYIERHLSLRDT